MWLPLAAAVAAPAPAPSCDRAAVDALATRLAGSSPSARPEVLAAAWPSLCQVDAWHDVSAEVAQVGDPVRVRLVELQLAVGRAHVLPELCSDPAPALVFSQASKMSERDGRAFVYERCLLNRAGFYTLDEFAGATGAWLSLFAWGELRSGGLPANAARPLVRAVAGLSP